MEKSSEVKIKWGKIAISNKEYHDALIYGETVEEREYERLKELFGTAHKIGDWEIKKLFSNDPDTIIIGTGWAGVVKVPPAIEKEAEHRGIELKPLKSPKAVKEFNRLVAEGKKVNALIHATC
jgi:hypothetical protein